MAAPLSAAQQDGTIILAQAPQDPKEKEKADKAKQKGAPPAQQKPAPPPPQAQPQPPKQAPQQAQPPKPAPPPPQQAQPPKSAPPPPAAAGLPKAPPPGVPQLQRTQQPPAAAGLPKPPTPPTAPTAAKPQVVQPQGQPGPQGTQPRQFGRQQQPGFQPAGQPPQGGAQGTQGTATTQPQGQQGPPARPQRQLGGQQQPGGQPGAAAVQGVQPQGLQTAPGAATPQAGQPPAAAATQPQGSQGQPGGQPRQFGGQQQPGVAPGAPGAPGVPPQGLQVAPGTPPQAPQGMQPRQFGRQAPAAQPGAPGPQYVQPQQMLKPQGIASVDALRSQRRERVEAGGRTVIVEPGNRIIVREQGRAFIRHDETQRFRIWGGPPRMEMRGAERYAYVSSPGGYQIITVTDGSGRMLRRVRRGPDGREIVLIDNRPRFGVGAAVGVGFAAGLLLGLAAPVITIPRERYIVDTSVAPAPLLYETLEAAPLVDIERPYTLDEIRYNVALRDRMRRVDVDTITFDTGSWEISPEQQERLQGIGEAMAQVLAKNPDEVFLIEGHTDAVGNENDNLSLSDRRAESVAVVLTDTYQIPPENLTTQGYGEQHLKVPIDGPSPENRRASVRRITPLLQGAVASR